MCDTDEAATRQPESARVLVESGLEWAQGEVGDWVDDSLALARPWGFDLGEIEVPVLLSYGRTDVLVPSGHGDWLAARIPRCDAWVDDGGHFAQDPAAELRQRYEWLLDRRADAD